MDLSGYVLILKETEDNKAKLLGKYTRLILQTFYFTLKEIESKIFL